MTTKPTLERTSNYGRFDFHPLNRPLHEDKVLEASMASEGFWPDSPIACVRSGAGRLRIVKGHHRFTIAKRLGIPVYYVVVESPHDPWHGEGGKSRWQLNDFIEARAAGGDKDCKELRLFAKKHKIAPSRAASLLGGESAGSGNMGKAVKMGTFRVGDTSHACAVVSLTDHLSEIGVAFATSSAFVSALSKVLRLPEFDADLFRHRVAANPAMMRKRATSTEYLDEIESAYNYAAKGRRLPLAFMATEASLRRKETFGGRNKKKGAA